MPVPRKSGRRARMTARGRCATDSKPQTERVAGDRSPSDGGPIYGYLREPLDELIKVCFYAPQGAVIDKACAVLVMRCSDPSSPV